MPAIFTGISFDGIQITENRNITELPKFFVEKKFNYKYLKQLNDYVNDNIGFRKLFISIHSNIMLYIFDTSSNNTIIKGKNNWLFYDSYYDGAPTMDYMGYNVFSEDDMQRITNNLLEFEKMLKEKYDCEFVLFIAPNKNRIYNEYMPDCFPSPNKINRISILKHYILNNSNIRIIDPAYSLISNKKSTNYNLYYKADSH